MKRKGLLRSRRDYGKKSNRNLEMINESLTIINKDISSKDDLIQK